MSEDTFDPAKDFTPEESFDPSKDVQLEHKAAPERAPDTSAADRAALTQDQGHTAASHLLNAGLWGLGNKGMAALYALREQGDSAPFKQRYAEALAREDGVEQNNAKAWPKTVLASDIGGGLITAPITGGAGGFARAGATGAAMGAVNAYGSDRSDTWGGTAKNVAIGGAEGAVAGAVLHGAGRLVGKGTSLVKQYLADKASSAKQGVIDGAVSKLGGEVYPEGIKAQLDNREMRGIDSWGKGGDSSISSEVDTNPGVIESTKARQGRMAAKVGRDVRQAHAILANPSGFSEQEVAAARAVADANGGPTTSYRGMPNAGKASKNVMASATGDNTVPMTSKEIRSNFERGGTPPEASDPVPPSWDGKNTAPLPEMKSAKPYARSYDPADFGKPIDENPLQPEAQPHFDPNEPTANLGPNGNARKATPAPDADVGKVLPAGATGSGIDDMAREFEFKRAMELGQGGTPATAGDVLMGAGRGALATGAKSMLPAGGLGMLNHSLGMTLEGGSLAKGALNGAADALSPGQKALMLQGASNGAQSIDRARQMMANPATRAMGFALMRSIQSQAKGPKADDKRQP